MNEPSSAQNYDAALSFLFWSWGCADGFKDGRSDNSSMAAGSGRDYGSRGQVSHRSALTDLLVSHIKVSNPWVQDPVSGRAPVDWLWLSERPSLTDFQKVMRACLSHPGATASNTWSNRFVYNSHGLTETSATIFWLNAITSHVHAPSVIQEYASLGGRLDCVNFNGFGVMAQLRNSCWSTIESFLSAAEKQGVSIMASPPGKTWVSVWASSSSATDLITAQQNIASLAVKYPQATRSLVSPVDEISALIALTPGKRTLSAAWKRLDMDVLVKKDTSVALSFRLAAIAQAFSFLKITRTPEQVSSLSFLMSKVSKFPVLDLPDEKAISLLTSGLAESKIGNQTSWIMEGFHVMTSVPTSLLPPTNPLDAIRWIEDVERAIMLLPSGPNSPSLISKSDVLNTFEIGVLKYQASLAPESFDPDAARSLLDMFLSAGDRWLPWSEPLAFSESEPATPDSWTSLTVLLEMLNLDRQATPSELSSKQLLSRFMGALSTTADIWGFVCTIVKSVKSDLTDEANDASDPSFRALELLSYFLPKCNPSDPLVIAARHFYETIASPDQGNTKEFKKIASSWLKECLLSSHLPSLGPSSPTPKM